MHRNYKNIAEELVLILSVSLMLAFAVNFFSPKGIALVGQWDTSQGVITAKAKADVVVRELEIKDVLKVKEIFAAGKAVFVDARPYERYKEGHIKGSVSMPLNQFDECIEGFLIKYPLSKFIVTYCSGRECEESHALAQYLIEEGYTHVRIFIDGFYCWEKEGY
ncbi:MAG: rhodanese-like domain-containing protein, partial [Deltaproteobacteria bacterium]|nr:rhodanese-like domain-containing protein [Deltaproteobacteria bacterium]